MDFRQVEHEFQQLKTQYDAGTLSEADFKARLQDLMIQDEQGRWWMIGYETGQWYVHDGGKWVQSEPPPVKPAGSGVTVGPVAAPAAPSRRRWVWVAAGIVGLILVVIVIAQLARQPQPRPAPAPAPPGPGDLLWADRYEIRRGECTVLHWDEPGTPWVRLVGPGFDPQIQMPRGGQKEICPPDTAGFALQSPDGKVIAEVVIRVLQ